MNKNKFKNFPEVYYVSVIHSKDRRVILEEQLNNCNIKNINSLISTTESDNENVVSGPFVYQLSYNHIGCITSHLKAIKKWYMISESPYAVFFEDDISLETAEYWNFTWEEFMDNLPLDWECIQLACIRDKDIQMNIKKRAWDDWSISAYMITRDYAKRLLDAYYENDEFTLDLKNTIYWPVAENVIYFIGRTYTFPLLIENLKFETVFEHRIADDIHNTMHLHSATFVLNWWKNNVDNDIKKLMDVKYYQNNIEFNR